MNSITPDFFFKNIMSLNENSENAEKRGVPDEDRALYALSKTKGWKVLLEYITTLSGELNGLNKTAISSGASLEEIGRNTIVVNLVQEVIEKIINKVSDAVDACENEQ